MLVPKWIWPVFALSQSVLSMGIDRRGYNDTALAETGTTDTLPAAATPATAAAQIPTETGSVVVEGSSEPTTSAAAVVAYGGSGNCDEWCHPKTVTCYVTVEKIRTIVTTEYCTVTQTVTDYCTVTESTTIIINQTVVDETTIFQTQTLVQTIENTTTVEITATVDNTVEVTATVDNTVEVTATVDNTVEVTATVDNTVEVTATVDNTIETTTTVDNTVEVTATVDNTIEVTATVENTIETTVPITVSVETTVPTTVPTTVLSTVSVETTVEVTVVSLSIQPAVTVTLTQSGTVITTTQPASTVFVTSLSTLVTTIAQTQTLPPITQTLPPVTQTLPPVTQTVPVTDTLTTTSVITEVVTCPAPTPTLGSTYDPKSNLTWGCTPGYVCNPDKPGQCNIWADSPVDSYSCHPTDCIISPLFKPVNWTDNSTTYYPPTEGYFNLAPIAFGLSYDIFELDIIVSKVQKHSYTTISTGNWESQTTLTSFDTTMLTGAVATVDPQVTTSPTEHGSKPSKRRNAERDLSILWKRGGTPLPAVCFDICNNCYLEAQAVGKTPGLCDPSSAFRKYYDGCNECIDQHADADKVGVVKREYLEPKFAQWVTYCDVVVAIPIDNGSAADNPQSVVSGTTTESSEPQETVNTITTSGAAATTTATGTQQTTSTAAAPASTTTTTSPTGAAGSSTGGSGSASTEGASTTTGTGSASTSESNISSADAISGSGTAGGGGGSGGDETSATTSGPAVVTTSSGSGTNGTSTANPTVVTVNPANKLGTSLLSLFLPILASLIFI